MLEGDLWLTPGPWSCSSSLLAQPGAAWIVSRRMKLGPRQAMDLLLGWALIFKHPSCVLSCIAHGFGWFWYIPNQLGNVQFGEWFPFKSTKKSRVSFCFMATGQVGSALHEFEESPWTSLRVLATDAMALRGNDIRVRGPRATAQVTPMRILPGLALTPSFG